jgi:hypothetical protein
MIGLSWCGEAGEDGGAGSRRMKGRVRVTAQQWGGVLAASAGKPETTSLTRIAAAVVGVGAGMLLSYVDQVPRLGRAVVGGLLTAILAVLLPHNRMTLSRTYGFLYDGCLYIFVTRARRRKVPTGKDPDAIVRSISFHPGT